MGNRGIENEGSRFDPTGKKSRPSIVLDYFIGRKGAEFDTYKDPEHYDAGAHSALYRRDNLARGVADVVQEHLPHGAATHVLDIGAGTGILTLELAKRGNNVTAIDLFQGTLDRLTMKAAEANLADKITPVQADMNAPLPFADNSFGSVVSLRATRYITDFEGWLGEARRVVEPNGSFVLPVFPVDTVPWKRHSELGIHQPTSFKGVTRTIQNAGFEIDQDASLRYTKAVDLSRGERDVPFYYKPHFVVCKKKSIGADFNLILDN